jgi:hypothetical protein
MSLVDFLKNMHILKKVPRIYVKVSTHYSRMSTWNSLIVDGRDVNDFGNNS